MLRRWAAAAVILAVMAAPSWAGSNYFQGRTSSGGAVSSVTGSGNTTCSPTTGSVVCTTTAGAAPAGSAGDLQTYATSSTFGHLTPGGAVASALAVAVGSAGSFVVNGGALGTPSSGVATNLTGTAAGLTAGHVTTNANLTGPVISVGNATTFVGPLPATGVSAGSYTASNLTVGADGRITAAANGSGGGTAGAYYSATDAGGTSPASTSTFNMGGLGASITPASSGKVLFLISGAMVPDVTTAGHGVNAKIQIGTGTAPAFHDAVVGTTVGNLIVVTTPTTVVVADSNFPFTLQGLATGLTVGTTYWFDLALLGVGDANVAVNELTITAVEIP